MRQLKHRAVNGAPKLRSLPYVAEPGCNSGSLAPRSMFLTTILCHFSWILRPLLFLPELGCVWNTHFVLVSFLQNTLHSPFICLELSPLGSHKFESLTSFRFLVSLRRMVFCIHLIWKSPSIVLYSPSPSRLYFFSYFLSLPEYPFVVSICIPWPPECKFHVCRLLSCSPRNSQHQNNARHIAGAKQMLVEE